MGDETWLDSLVLAHIALTDGVMKRRVTLDALTVGNGIAAILFEFFPPPE